MLSLALKTNAQNYHISFVGTGVVTTIDSVKVENLTQGTSVKLNAGDTLQLTVSTGINDLNVNDEKMQVYPNPMQGQTELSFYAKQAGNAQVIIYDISGKKVLYANDKISQGIQKYKLISLKQGMYFVSISGNGYFYTTKLISLSTTQGEAKIEYLGNQKQEEVVIAKLKSTKATASMAYATGNILRFIGFSGIYSAVINDVPTSSKTITFTFTTLPTITTSSVSSITSTTAISGGNVISDGGYTVTARGVCYDTLANPTTANNIIASGSGIGSFTANITGLTPNTSYYVRAYATNSIGTAYGQQIAYNTITAKKELFNQMLTWMCGSFSSHNHADTTVNQYIVDVRLKMAQIWSNRNVGENIYWLYVEQAYASDTNAPYRQRIYKVMMDTAGNIYDEIYAIPSPSTYLHGYNNPSVFNSLNASNLTIKIGCNVAFTWNVAGQYYVGSTTGHTCLAAGVPGVSYITSDATIHQTYMTSWDRGYSASGLWVMGPDWPYIFDKVATYPFAASK